MAKKVQLTDNGVDIYPVTTSDVVAGLANVARTGSYNDLSDRPAVHGVPSGGTSGQVLKKASGTDYDVAWANESGGSELFKVTSYETPFQDIWDAHEAGKLCVIDDDSDEQYLLGAIDGGRAFFYQVYEGGSVYWYKVDENDEWTTGDYPADSIFWATYGVTSFADIMDAFGGGKLVVAKSPSGTQLYYPFSISIGTQAVWFFNISDDVISIVIVTASQGWRNTDEYSFVTDDLLSDINEKYRKPTGGIPKTDLASAVQTSLGKADTALQSFTETDPTVPAWAKEPTKPDYSLAELQDDATHRTVTDAEKATWNEKYTKPANGIPGSDIAAGVIPDVSQFITKSVNDLVNYYTKSQTYTKDEVAALIGAIQQFHYEIVATLPATGAGNILYLLGPTGTGADKYEEYVYANSTWTKIGDTSIDLSGYVTTTALNTALANYLSINDVVQAQEIGIDSTPTENSQNLVTSGGIYAALGKYGVISQTQTWTGSASTGYTYTMSNQVWGLIPQAFIDEVTAFVYDTAGITFNETTGYFELNGLTDISYDEMRVIWATRQRSGYDYAQPAILPRACRTNFTLCSAGNGNGGDGISISSPMLLQCDIEYFRFSIVGGYGSTTTPGKYKFTPYGNLFYRCNYLRIISDNLEITRAQAGMFTECYSLEWVAFRGLAYNVDLHWSPNLRTDCLAYTINNAGTAAITITLHATAYARAIADADVQAALAAKTNVTLASA